MVLDLLKWLKKHVSINKKIKTWTLHSMQEVGRKKNLAQCFKKWKLYDSPQKKKKKKKTIGYFL